MYEFIINTGCLHKLKKNIEFVVHWKYEQFIRHLVCILYIYIYNYNTFIQLKLQLVWWSADDDDDE